jgi:hypothetical protein
VPAKSAVLPVTAFIAPSLRTSPSVTRPVPPFVFKARADLGPTPVKLILIRPLPSR